MEDQATSYQLCPFHVCIFLCVVSVFICLYNYTMIVFYCDDEMKT